MTFTVIISYNRKQMKLMKISSLIKQKRDLAKERNNDISIQNNYTHKNITHSLFSHQLITSIFYQS